MNQAVELFTNAVAPRVPESYYESPRKEFLITDKNGNWIALNETQYKRVLKKAGFSPRVASDVLVSPMDDAILFTQSERNVQYAGPLAGYKRGLYTFAQMNVLVTTSPFIIEAQPGAWSVLLKLFEAVIGGVDAIQLDYFFGWLKVAFLALRDGVLMFGQAMVFVGPHGCGKSLIQKLITLILGGRAAKPYQFMSNGSPFNSDLFGAEHLMIEDEQPSTDIRSRRNFGAQIKNITVNEVQRLHGKHRDAITLSPFWRLTISLNDEPENVMVLPPIDDSLEDKLIIFRAHRGTLPMPTETMEQRKAFWNQLVSELPAFLDYLTKWEIPQELRNNRFGVGHYHHPEILRILNDLAPELRLLNLIDECYFSHADMSFTAPKMTDGYLKQTAEQIERRLTDSASVSCREARNLLSWNSATGTYLGRLAKAYPHRVQGARTSESRVWHLYPPTITTPQAGQMTP